MEIYDVNYIHHNNDHEITDHFFLFGSANNYQSITYHLTITYNNHYHYFYPNISKILSTRDNNGKKTLATV
ncbi:hypothetical protein DERP_009685 [Dermatophagoides pteronyssinus]|uniref:Uncharacterized protein n=1 Tax=Dermatophagoides pteronyssinus TaxID=6956 RepID=A0ABQ8JAJ7_DERPT|nr:hypothetical protein DERP_009685 [Dermatophagoides pteronyssinus]